MDQEGRREALETSLRALCKRLMDRDMEIESKEKLHLHGSSSETERELVGIESRIADGNEKLRLLEASIRRKAEEHERMTREFEDVAELKERRLSRVQKRFEEAEKECEVERERLRELQGRCGDREKELRENEEILKFVKSEISSCLGELAMKEKKASLVKKLSERNLEAWNTIVENCSRVFDREVRKFEGWIRDVELKELLGPTSEGTDLIRENALGSLSTEARLGECLKRYNSVCGEMCALFRASSDPAMLALSEIKRDSELDANLVRRRSSLLCDPLMSASPSSVDRRVREEAVKLARDWKGKLSVASENRLEVWDFLQFLVSYNLSTEFDACELQGLLGVVGLNCDLRQSRPRECSAVSSKRKVRYRDEDCSTGSESAEEWHQPRKAIKTCLFSNERNGFTARKGKSRSTRKRKPNSKILSGKAKLAALEKASGYETDCPSFKILIQPTRPFKDGVVVESKFANQYMTDKCNFVNIKASGDERTWRVKYRRGTTRPNYYTTKLWNGWSEFARDHNLKALDVCVFVLLEGSTNSFKVEIFRDDEKRSSSKPPLSPDVPTTSKRPGNSLTVKNQKPRSPQKQHPITMDEKAKILERVHFESSRPNFKVLIQQSYTAPYGGFLSVPAEFWRQFIKEDCNSILSCNGKSWPAEILIVQQDQTTRVQFRAGWKQFAADNNLKVYDVCLFELVDEVKMSFNVQIHRYKDK